MDIKRINITIIFSLCVMLSFAQTLSPKVQPAQGGSVTGGNLQLQPTIGEPLISTFKAGSNQISLGFEQPEMNIVIDSSVVGPYSSSAQIGIPFNAKGIFGPGNIFTVQLSSPTGSFGSRTSIGSDTTQTSGTVVVNIPSTATSSNYRMRIISSYPPFTIDSIFGPVYTMQFISGVNQDTIYLTDSLKFTTPQYYYTSSDSIYFSYHVIDPSSGSEVVSISPVKYTSDGYYVADNLSALTSGSSYRLEFLLYNGYRYSFNLKKN